MAPSIMTISFRPMAISFTYRSDMSECWRCRRFGIRYTMLLMSLDFSEQKDRPIAYSGRTIDIKILSRFNYTSITIYHIVLPLASKFVTWNSDKRWILRIFRAENGHIVARYFDVAASNQITITALDVDKPAIHVHRYSDIPDMIKCQVSRGVTHPSTYLILAFTVRSIHRW